MSVRVPEVSESLVASLAVSLATGESITCWAQRTKTPLRTAYGLYHSPRCKALVRSYRGKLVNRALDLAAKRMASCILKHPSAPWPKRTEVTKQIS